MNIKELKEKIKDLPDDMLIGGSGHYGEFLECYSIQVNNVTHGGPGDWNDPMPDEDILCISIEDAGTEPD